MYIKILFILSFLITSISAENPSYYLFNDYQENQRTSKDYILGSAIIATEYVVFPMMMRDVWWKNGFELVNPFNVPGKDEEPFHIDEGWHAAMTYFTQEAHYTILRTFFGVESPYPSMAMTMFSWTFIEAADAMAIGDKWVFSWHDEFGNMAGVLNWYIHHKYPEFKFYIRAGIRRWDAFDDYVAKSPLFFTDYKAYSTKFAYDKYWMSKVEYIYKLHDEFYSGVVISKDIKLRDIWGFTVGWDGLAYLNKHSNGWWNYPARVFGSSFSLSLSLTVWHKDDLITFF